MAFLYGSRAHGFAKVDSDVDIAILFREEQDREENVFSTMTAVSLFLSTELKAEVNVIPLYRDFRKPYLYYNAIVKGILLYTTDYKSYVALRAAAVDQMEDYDLFGKRWQMELARRNLADLTNTENATRYTAHGARKRLETGEGD